MKYIKLFESFEDIHRICEKYNITNYIINNDGSIDVDGDVDFFSKNLTKLPLKFRNVRGGFYCPHNQLTSLEGCPKSVGGHFYCHNNRLTSLEGCPKSVGGGFYCNHNQLTSLEGGPKSVGGEFYCHSNRLTSLEGSPESVSGNFFCNNNQITSLEGFPNHVGDNFYCIYNPVFEIWKLFGDKEKVELFNDYDMIRGDNIILDRLNDFLIRIGKHPVENVKGYNNI